MGLRWLACAAALQLAACGLAKSDPRCVMGLEHTLARAPGLSFDALALTALAGASFAFWSDGSGLHGARLTKAGGLDGAVVPLGRRCEGGLSAQTLGDAVWLACLRPFLGDDASGFAVLMQLDTKLHVTATRTLGAAGRASDGIDLIHDGGSLAAAWHDGGLDTGDIWVWRDGAEAERVTLSAPNALAGSPTLARAPEGLLVAWAESLADPSVKERRLLMARVGAKPTVVTTVQHETPTPRLRRVGEGLTLAFRDRERGRKPGLYVSRVSADGKLLGEVTRLSRADAAAGPAMIACFDGLLAVSPRTFGGNRFVGINWVDASLSRASQERQFYEDARQFALAAGVCLGEQARLLIAEQGSSERADVFLREVDFRCH